ncbi:MAG: metalloregulator ArsR/SmtB family transcription factor, partial [Pseudomonadota bacterium]
LNDVFSALGDPTRRAILVALRQGETKVSDLPVAGQMSLTGLAKHVNVLAKAGLVSHEKRGRDRICRLEPIALKHVAEWIDQYRQFWEGQLDSLETFLVSAEEESL